MSILWKIRKNKVREKNRAIISIVNVIVTQWKFNGDKLANVVDFF